MEVETGEEKVVSIESPRRPHRRSPRGPGGRVTTPHDLWQVLRKNLTHRDLYPKRRYPLWTDPVTGLPCRSGPDPANKNAGPRRQEKVIRESESERESLQARLLARAQVRRCLTETQYRRVAYLLGFDTPELSQRDVAEIEGVARPSVQDSIALAEANLESNAYVWLMWLMGNLFIPSTRYTPTGRGGRNLTRHQGERVGQLVEAGHGFTHTDIYPGEDGWESDRFTPRSPYDRDIDRLTDEFLNGSLTRVEYNTDMVMALAEERNPDGGAEARHELRQEVEWAMSARSLGAITSRECDRRVSLALRSYVGGE